jgi:hypothetical protein
MLFEFYLSSLCAIYFWAAQKHMQPLLSWVESSYAKQRKEK